MTITAKDVESRIDAEVKKIAPQVRMPGFRPGKVPANLVKKMHKDSLLQDALNSTIQEGVQKAISDNKLRPATQPHVQSIWAMIMRRAKTRLSISIWKFCLRLQRLLSMALRWSA
jgi:FKBP-type peptidyl-prolyl cis-trans isomerase (trigger factor)